MLNEKDDCWMDDMIEMFIQEDGDEIEMGQHNKREATIESSSDIRKRPRYYF